MGWRPFFVTSRTFTVVPSRDSARIRGHTMRNLLLAAALITAFASPASARNGMDYVREKYYGANPELTNKVLNRQTGVLKRQKERAIDEVQRGEPGSKEKLQGINGRLKDVLDRKAKNDVRLGRDSDDLAARQAQEDALKGSLKKSADTYKGMLDSLRLGR